MNKHHLLIISILTALLVGCEKQKPAGIAPPATQPTTQSSAEVVIDNFTFTPATLTVPAGTQVTWINHDDIPHTATSSVKPRLFDSKTLDTDEKFSFTFTTPGTFPYYCTVHPHMTGTVIVK